MTCAEVNVPKFTRADVRLPAWSQLPSVTTILTIQNSSRICHQHQRYERTTEDDSKTPPVHASPADLDTKINSVIQPYMYLYIL